VKSFKVEVGVNLKVPGTTVAFVVDVLIIIFASIAFITPALPFTSEKIDPFLAVASCASAPIVNVVRLVAPVAIFCVSFISPPFALPTTILLPGVT
jgi:hypothetical protein